ncbi:PAS domain-containing protein [Syntrophomonas palmitatica]|uniref:PAS domain-containing protein n=1 Tax=Syntrophomonas palmitatica TaxID=402877 RepID=UPI0006D23EC7|nr:PAS domain S-box protein [Syntrophomonas palmitatica]
MKDCRSQDKNKAREGQPLFNEHERMRLMAAAIENSSHPFLVGFKDGRIALFNHAFCLLTGYSEAELYLLNWKSDLTPAKWHDIQAVTIEEVYRTRQVLCYEKEYLRKDGSRVPVEVLIHPYIDDDGEIVYYYGFVTDLTARNQALEQLRKSQFQLHEISENMLDMYCKVDNSGIIQYSSPSYSVVLGYSPEELMGTLVFDLVYYEDREHIIDEFYTHLNSRIPGRFEYRCLHADGHYLYMETIGKPLLHGEGTEGAILVSRDITERKMAENALRQSEEKFSKIFLCSPDTISITTLEGRYVDVNDAWTQLTGYERHEVIGRTSLELGLWVDPTQREYLINKLNEQGSLRGVETRHRTKSGEILTALFSMEKST